MIPRSWASGAARSAAGQAVLPELVAQDALADPEQLGGPCLDAVGARERVADQPPLEALHRGGEARGLRAAVEGLERRMIRDALARADGVQTRAAELLGISERVLRYKLRKYGLAGG